MIVERATVAGALICVMFQGDVDTVWFKKILVGKMKNRISCPAIRQDDILYKRLHKT